RDRVVTNQIGRLLFLKRQYKEAIAELEKVLAVDPEDLQAHYNLMLSYQGLGDAEMAKKQQALYERFKADESAQFITGPYRQLHPPRRPPRPPPRRPPPPPPPKPPPPRVPPPPEAPRPGRRASRRGPGWPESPTGRTRAEAPSEPPGSPRVPPREAHRPGRVRF